MRFANVSAVSGLDFPDDGRCVVVVDWDHDGDLDLWMRNRTAPKLRLMINQTVSSAEGNSFVAFKLTGTSCNRDAIGARVEVKLTDATAGRLIQTLRAGDGYLSQSSKWLHFGLAKGTAIKGVSVRWPDGQQEQFGAVAGGRRYKLRQGSGEAQPASTKPRSVRLAASRQPRDTNSSVAQVLLPRRIPLPDLFYRGMNDEKKQSLRAGSQTKLVMLWASTCPHCRRELTSLAKSKSQLDAAGLDVLALNVDQLSVEGAVEGAVDVTAAQKFLDDIKFPYRTGRASGALLDKIQHLIGALFDSEVPLAVPLGLLIDSEGNLLAVYRGPPPRDVLLFDARHADADEQQRRDMAAPFPGRWYTQHPGRPALLELLADHFQEDYPDEAVGYLEMALPEVKNAAAKQSLEKRMAALHYYLASQQVASNDLAGAERSLARVVELQPQNRKARQQLEDVQARRRLRDEK